MCSYVLLLVLSISTSIYCIRYLINHSRPGWFTLPKGLLVCFNFLGLGSVIFMWTKRPTCNGFRCFVACEVKQTSRVLKVLLQYFLLLMRVVCVCSVALFWADLFMSWFSPVGSCFQEFPRWHRHTVHWHSQYLLICVNCHVFKIQVHDFKIHVLAIFRRFPAFHNHMLLIEEAFAKEVAIYLQRLGTARTEEVG